MNRPPRIALGNLPTPLRLLPRLSRRLGREIWVKHDDLTGMALSGNKVRKLEYLLAAARAAGATRLVTCGGPQSNHARATAVAGRHLGLPTTIVVREQPGGPAAGPDTGNALIDALVGAEVVTIPFDAFQATGGEYGPHLTRMAEQLTRRGETPHVVPEGGSTPLGAWGYLDATAELAADWQRTGRPGTLPDNIFAAVGSGGTHAGLRLGVDALGVDPDTVCGVNVTATAAHFAAVVADLMTAAASEFGLTRDPTTPRIVDGYVGDGYALATDDELRFQAGVAREEGILLDPVYTGKAFLGMVTELQHHPDDYGERIVFLHTGGLFGTFAHAEQYARALGAMTD